VRRDLRLTSDSNQAKRPKVREGKNTDYRPQQLPLIPMDLTPTTHHVFVDFENIHTIDLDVIGQQGISFTLLIGAKQTKIDTALVEKLLLHASSVQLVRLTSSGRNALDFTLAYYVGRAVAADPAGIFHLISKDTGYDALVTHLRSQHIQAYRHGDFAGLPFLSEPKHSARARANAPEHPAPAKPTALQKPSKVPKITAPVLDENTSHVLAHLKEHPKSRPSREKTLVRHVLALLGNKLPEPDAQNIINALSQAGYIIVNEKGGLAYQLPA
jgi:hypothetical protein